MSSTGLGIGGYRDLTEINRGAFATVFRAWQPTFERDVAIKVLSGRPDDGVIRRFERECVAIGALSGHPNIVTVYDAGTSADGQPYLVMEYLPAGSLADRLHREGPFDVAEVLDLGIRIAGALESAHQAGILHRDLKPENILLSRLGEPKVADFGVAQLPDRSQTISGGVIGTVAHAAPEVLAGDDRRSPLTSTHCRRRCSASSGVAPRSCGRERRASSACCSEPRMRHRPTSANGADRGRDRHVGPPRRHRPAGR